MNEAHPNAAHATAAAHTILLADELRTLPSDERERALASIRLRDGALAALLESLLDPSLAGTLDAPTRVFTSFGLGEPLRTPDLAPGTRLGAFELVAPLATGGMGAVWRARQAAPDREVAVKIVHRASADEAAILARIRHPSIATVHARGHDEVDGARIDWIAMELVEDARPLDRAARDLALPARLALLRETCEAIGRAHALGIVHGDLKPSNILVDGQGRVKIIDFGAGCIGPTAAHARGARYGTPAYLAPELLSPGAAASPACDVYALGLLLYAIVHGALPRELASGSAIDILLARDTVRTDRAPDGRAAGLAPDLAAILAKATATDTARRYPDAEALADDLARHLDRREVSARPRGRLGRLALAARRNPVATSAAALTTLALVLAVAVSSGFALYAAQAAGDAQTFANSISETHDSLLRVLEPVGTRDPADATRPIGDHLRDALARLELEVPMPRYADGVRATAASARTLEYLCIAFGMNPEAERAAALIDVLERKLGRARASAIVGPDLDGLYARLANDPTDQAALASLKALVPKVLHRQGVVRAEVFSRLLAVNFLREPRLTREVALAMLEAAPDDEETRLTAATCIGVTVLEVATGGQRLARDAREALRAEMRLVADTILHLAEDPNAATRASARGLANGLDLLASMNLVAARCPEIIPELLDIAIAANWTPEDATGPEPHITSLNWFDFIPLRLAEEGAYDACRAALAEIDRRNLVLGPRERTTIALARAELLHEDSGPAAALTSLFPLVDAERDPDDPLAVPDHCRVLGIAAELSVMAGDRLALDRIERRARRELESSDPPLSALAERDYRSVLWWITACQTADPHLVIPPDPPE